MHKLLIASLLTLASTGIAQANDTLDAANNQVILNLQNTHQNYREYDDNKDFLDGEMGFMPGIGIEVRHLDNGVYLRGAADYNKGDTDYTGQLQDGTKATATTGNKVINLNVQGGYLVNLGDNLLVGPYAELGYQKWDRTLDKDGQYYTFEENYHHYYGGLGVKADYAAFKGMTLSSHAGYGRTFGAKMSLDDEMIGKYNMALGGKVRYNAGVEADYAMTENFHVRAGVDYTRFKYGKSDLMLDQNGSGATAFEPASTTEQVKYTLGLGMSF